MRLSEAYFVFCLQAGLQGVMESRRKEDDAAEERKEEKDKNRVSLPRLEY